MLPAVHGDEAVLLDERQTLSPHIKRQYSQTDVGSKAAANQISQSHQPTTNETLASSTSQIIAQYFSREWLKDMLTIGEHYQPFLVVGDLQAFIFSFFNNLLNIAFAYQLLIQVAKTDPQTVQQRVLPGMGVSILFGCTFYWRQTRVLSKQRNLQRLVDASVESGDNCSSQLFGIATSSLIAFVILILIPSVAQHGPQRGAAILIFASFWSGIMEACTALYGPFLLRHVPHTALLASLTGVSIALLATDTLYQIANFPLSSLLPLFLFLLFVCAKIRVPVPSMLITICVGVALAWILHACGSKESRFISDEGLSLGFFYPRLSTDQLFTAFRDGFAYIAVFLPLAVLNGLLSLQCITSARNAGDEYSPRSSLLINGLSTIVSACLGNPFPTSIYVGHSTLKHLGGRSAFILFTGIAIFVITTSGMLPWILSWLPLSVLLPILVYVGLDITVEGFTIRSLTGEQSDTVTTQRHLIAVALAIVPALASLTVEAVNSVMQATNATWLEVYPRFVDSGFYYGGAVALSQGFPLTSMFWAATLTKWVDRAFYTAAIYLAILALCSWLGLIHAYKVTDIGISNTFVGESGRWCAAPGFAFGYGVMGVVSMLLGILQQHNLLRFDEHEDSAEKPKPPDAEALVSASTD